MQQIQWEHHQLKVLLYFLSPQHCLLFLTVATTLGKLFPRTFAFICNCA